MAEQAHKNAEQPKRLDIQEEDIDALVDAFEEVDKEKAGKGEALIAEVAASLDKLGDDLQQEAAHKPEMERVAEVRAGLEKLVEKEAAVEVEYLLDGRQTMLGGDEMISMVIDLALERGGMKKGTKPEILAAFTANAELRAKAKEQLILTINAKMLDKSVGNDTEKISKLEKALDALGA